MRIKNGESYRVVQCAETDYLTVGEVYVAQVDGRNIGLHRVRDGAGTYLPAWRLNPGLIVRPVILEAVTL